ncbi:MAG: dihydroorotate dehydrogenase [Candidatus Omnitrophica bacterium]|nr:dihydroorotate dehydrogenase [Candidatus Omnitrophota bacterium]
MNLFVKIGKLSLKNPVLTASGTFGYGKEFEELVNLRKLGGIVTKTITLKPRIGNPQLRLVETASGIINSIGLQNEGLENFLDEKLPYLRKLGIPIIVSIGGKSQDEFASLAMILSKEKGISALEVNISCPNVQSKLKRLFAQDEDATYRLVKTVRKVTEKPIIVKLTPNVTDISTIALSAEKAGADAVSLINTFFAIAVDAETQKPKLGNITGGLSGPAIKPIALKMVWEVAKKVRIPVIGMGGIMNTSDAIEFILCGATAVAIGTGNFVNPTCAEEIVDGITEYLKRKKFTHIKDITGKLKA